MIEKWGVTFLKLDRQDHYGKKDSSKKGNYRAVIQECMPERYGSDPDIDRSRSDDNIYAIGDDFIDDFLGDDKEATGASLCDYIDSLVDNHRDALGRKARKDCVVAGAAIVKPSEDDREWSAMSDKDKDKFLQQACFAFLECFGDYKSNIVIDAAVIHKDERNNHMHIIFHDRKFNLGDKLGLGFCEELHRGAFVSYMSGKGYELKPHPKGITDQEQQKIKDLKQKIKDAPGDETAQNDLTELRRSIRKRKKSGKSSAEYKTEKQAERKAKQIVTNAQEYVSRAKQIVQDESEIKNKAERYKKTLVNEGIQDKAVARQEADQIRAAARKEADQIKAAAKQQAAATISAAEQQADRIKTAMRSAKSDRIGRLCKAVRKIDIAEKNMPDISRDIIIGNEPVKRTEQVDKYRLQYDFGKTDGSPTFPY